MFSLVLVFVFLCAFFGLTGRCWSFSLVLAFVLLVLVFAFVLLV